MGKLPMELQRALEAVLEPKVDWREKIQSLFARKIGSGTFDWRRPDRRLITRDIYAPGRSGFGAGTVVVGIDTSGSIGKLELDMFMAEMAGILEDVRPKRLVIIWCDAIVHRVDECEDAQDLNAIRRKGAPGGGGTSFIPVFSKIAELGLAAVTHWCISQMDWVQLPACCSTVSCYLGQHLSYLEVSVRRCSGRAEAQLPELPREVTHRRTR